MGMTFSHLLPGLAGFAATVFAPWYSADPGLIPIAIVLLLSLILFGVSVVVFHRSLKAKGKQGHTAESQMLQTLEQAIEKGGASLELEVVAPPKTHVEISSPLAELALQFDKALPESNTEPKTEHVQIPQMASNGTNGTDHDGIAHPPPNPARPETAHVETAHVSLPRLSELRGMRFSQAIRELDKAKRSAPPNAGLASINVSLNDAPADGHDDTLDDPIDDSINETLMSAIAPFESMFALTASAPQAQIGATAANRNGAQGLPSPQTFFPAKPSLPAKSRSNREEDSERSPREPKAPGKETNSFLDQLHILPSRRGQYKKKG
jgi:hypothetical protein